MSCCAVLCCASSLTFLCFVFLYVIPFFILPLSLLRSVLTDSRFLFLSIYFCLFVSAWCTAGSLLRTSFFRCAIITLNSRFSFWNSEISISLSVSFRPTVRPCLLSLFQPSLHLLLVRCSAPNIFIPTLHSRYFSAAQNIWSVTIPLYFQVLFDRCCICL